jgi:hypothetical protein
LDFVNSYTREVLTMDDVAEIKRAWEKWENSRPVRERNLSATGFNALLHGEPVSQGGRCR